jgi:phosphate-selective porin OprO/OprP
MFLSALAGVVLLLATSMPARAQIGDTSEKPASAPFTAGWKDGFTLQTDTGDFRLQLGLLLQADERVAVGDRQNNVTDSFLFRRIRPILQGRVARFFDFYFNPDFAGAIVNIRDAYVDTRFSQAFRVRVGKAKEPFGMERLHSASHLTFVERSLPTAVAPDRDVGIQVLGDVAGNVVSYAAGIFNGVADGQTAELDTNDGKDLVGRAVVRPFIRSAGNPLAGLGLAVAGSSGKQPIALSSFASSGRQTFFAYDRATTGEGVRNRISPQWFYSYKSFFTFGEYIRSTGTVTKDSVSSTLAHQSWVVAGSFVVTGEAGGDRGVKPANVFDPGRRAWGALQLTGRYHVLSVDRRAVTLGFAAAGSSRDARGFTIGANWFLNPYVKWVLNFERTVFDGDPNGPRLAENAFLLRHQITF